MSSIFLIDTSIFLNLINVPSCNQDREVVLEDFKTYSQSNCTFLLPMATIIETGNHIAQAKTTNSDSKRITSEKFAQIMIYAADETSPWAAFREQIVLWEAEGLKNLADKFPNQAVEKTSMGDASIVVLGWYYYHEKGFHVEFLTDDNGLKSQEPPQPNLPTRRSSRGK